jgi:hypothetical protein
MSLKEGMVEAAGKLADLLETCPEMQYLWQGERNEARVQRWMLFELVI